MSNIILKCELFKHRDINICFSVIQQETKHIRQFVPFTATNKIQILSASYPELNNSIIYLRGSSTLPHQQNKLCV